MPEILLRVADKINHGDFYKNLKCTKRGDVIVVREDGWVWGKDELALPFWRIIKFPFSDPADHDQIKGHLEALLSTEMATDPSAELMGPRSILQIRGFYLNLDHNLIGPDLRAYLLDDSRREPWFTISGAFGEVRSFIEALKTKRPPVADPAILGKHEAILG